MNSCKNILVALVVIACGLHRGGAQAPTCPADGSEVCFSCLAKGDCSVPDAPAEEGDKCAAGEACKVVSGVATCMPLANVPDCACDGGNTGCDAYNPLLSIFCVKVGSSKRLFSGTECAAPQACVKGRCEDAPENPCGDENGFFPVTPECTSSVFCFGGDEVTRNDCETGEYFNPETSACEVFPTNPCANCDKSKCPIISDCTKYAVCSNGQVQDGDESCAEGSLFDSDAEECVAADTVGGICASLKDCELKAPATSDDETALTSSEAPTSPDVPSPDGSNTTEPTPTDPTPTDPTPTDPTPTDPVTTKPARCTAANVNTRYPHETNCKKYYTCRLVTRTSYSYVESTCSGNLVFNPETNYCDLPAEVPDCVPPQ